MAVVMNCPIRVKEHEGKTLGTVPCIHIFYNILRPLFWQVQIV